MSRLFQLRRLSGRLRILSVALFYSLEYQTNRVLVLAHIVESNQMCVDNDDTLLIWYNFDG